ncbi:MAG TPA: polysaccharide deacetylase family protein [Emticicia sp.]
MKYNRNIHDKPQLVKALIGTLSYRLFAPGNRLLVLNFHSTPRQFIGEFESIIDFLEREFEIISPSVFFENYGQQQVGNKNRVLITFDDGLKNNQYALEVLDKRNISSLLFVVPDFITSNEPESYYIRNIRPIINRYIDHEKEDFTPMSWENLTGIVGKHSIGCHTLTHTMTKEFDHERLVSELIVSKKMIEEKLNISVNTFCSINNTLMSVGPEAKKMINELYDFHFTTIAGCNNELPDPHFIKRINVECFWLKGAFKFSLSNLNLNRQKAAVRLYNQV